MRIFILILLVGNGSLWAQSDNYPSKRKLEALYSSLDPLSISQLFAFYQLYPESTQGKRALEKAWGLMNLHRPFHQRLSSHLMLPFLDTQAIISLVNRQPYEPPTELSDSQLSIIEKISDHFGNRALKGHKVWKINELFPLKSKEVDLARALFLYEFSEDQLKVRQYEASIDLMALQILARLPEKPSDEEKIAEINQFIFHEMRFRFPPHSLWPKNVDTYTLLPSILDSRQGVCLGVSILYLSIAQRLNLPLEIITPPGHIYVRYRKGRDVLNIETTARGIHLPSENYLGINTRLLQKRTMKEVIGLSFINQAAVAWHNEEHQTAVDLYEKAIPYLPDDPLVKTFLGLNYLFLGEKKKGESLLKEVKDIIPDENVVKETMIDDYFAGRVNAEGIKTIFLPVNEKRSSIIEKQENIEKILKNYPLFREGHMHLAITYLQLGRGKEGLDCLLRYHKIDQENPTTEYYLAALCLERHDYAKAWEHVKLANAVLNQKRHSPKSLKDLERELSKHLRPF